MQTARLLISISLACVLMAASCGDEKNGSGGDSGTDPDDGGFGDAGEGDWCDENIDCQTGYCEAWQNVPQIEDSYCTEGPPAGQIRIIGNVRDFNTDNYAVGIEVRVVGAIDTIMDPVLTYQSPIVVATTDGDGIFETEAGEEAITEPYGLVYLVKTEGYYLTVSELAEPNSNNLYPPGATNHDVNMVAQSRLDTWSDYLSEFDASLELFLPLGENGGTVGRVRYVENGEGVVGATIVSQSASSTARVYYLDEDGSGFNDQATSANGMFVILEPAIGERFEAWKDGEIISRRSVAFAETFGAIYAAVFHVED